MAGFLLSAAGAFGHTCGVRVDGAFGPKVVAACRRRVMFANAQGATALRAEGCGIALSGNEYKVRVTREGS